MLPWDTLLFETMVLALWLPPTHSLPTLAAVSAPAPALTWAFRLLLFRVMFGAGLIKLRGDAKLAFGGTLGIAINGGNARVVDPAGNLTLAVDVAGNEASDAVTGIDIDRTQPSLTGAPDEIRNDPKVIEAYLGPPEEDW